jgi:hypothetical protein
MRATHGAPEFRGAVRELLVAARTMLSADYAEIVLFESLSEGALRSVVTSSTESLMEPRHTERGCHCRSRGVRAGVRDPPSADPARPMRSTPTS